MATFPRSVSLAVFRPHLENGLSVAMGVGLTGLAVGGALGFPAAVAAATGALCTSLADRNDPLRLKAWLIGFGVLCTIFFTGLSSFARFSTPAFVIATAFTGMACGLISAYGRWSLSVAMCCILAFVFAMGQHLATPSDAADHLLLTACGAIIYAVYALVTGWWFDDRGRRLLLSEAMQAF